MLDQLAVDSRKRISLERGSGDRFPALVMVQSDAAEVPAGDRAK